MKKEFRILAWTLTWTILLLAFAEILLSNGYPWKFASLEPYFIRDNTDAWTRIGFQIEELKQAASPNEDKKVFIFLGGSVGLEAITTDREMTALLSNRFEKPVLFKSLCSSYKTFADELKIIEALGNINASIIINTEILRFKTTIDKQISRFDKKTGHENLKYYFLPTSKYARGILEQFDLDVGIKHQFRVLRTGMVFGEILKKKASRYLFSSSAQVKSTFVRHASDGKKPVDPERFAELSDILTIELKNIDQAYQMNYLLFKAAIAKAQSNQNRVILADIPINPLFENQMASFTQKYNELTQNLVQQYGITYCDLRNAADWRPEDFRDLHHMLPSGRKKYTAALAEKLALIVNKR